jgi:aryl carrier-like protein
LWTVLFGNLELSNELKELKTLHANLAISHESVRAELLEALAKLQMMESTEIDTGLVGTLEEKVSALERQLEDEDLRRKDEEGSWRKEREENELKFNQLVSRQTIELSKKDEEVRKSWLALSDLEAKFSRQMEESRNEIKSKEESLEAEKDLLRKGMELLKTEKEKAIEMVMVQMKNIGSFNSKKESAAKDRLSALEIEFAEGDKILRAEIDKMKEKLISSEETLKEKEREITMANQSLYDLREQETQNSNGYRETIRKLETENEQLNCASDELMINLELLDTDLKDVSRKYAEERETKDRVQKELDEKNKLILEQLDSMREMKDNISKEKQKGQFELKLLQEKHDLTQQLLLQANQKLALTESDLLNARKGLEEPSSESRDKDLIIEKFRADLMRVILKLL